MCADRGATTRHGGTGRPRRTHVQVFLLLHVRRRTRGRVFDRPPPAPTSEGTPVDFPLDGVVPGLFRAIAGQKVGPPSGRMTSADATPTVAQRWESERRHASLRDQILIASGSCVKTHATTPEFRCHGEITSTCCGNPWFTASHSEQPRRFAVSASGPRGGLRWMPPRCEAATPSRRERR